MKNIVFLFAGLSLIVTSCNKSTDIKVSILAGDPITDIDGNTYRTIQIGDQTWMQENLRVTRYADGTPITMHTTGFKNSFDDKAAYFSDSNRVYGLLYNWAAAVRSDKGCSTKENLSDVKRQGICPNGWHLASDKEWETLVDNLGGRRVAGGRMKTTGFSDWREPNLGATNESLFSALPSGQYYNGFDSLGYYAYFWSATQRDAYGGGSVYLGYHWDEVDLKNSAAKTAGLACRCIKD